MGIRKVSINNEVVLDLSSIDVSPETLLKGATAIDRNGNIIMGNADIYSMVEPNAGAHNSLYRGKYLGNTVTEDQYDAIDDGTFDDIFIGDYWTISNINYRVAAFDYWLNCGDTGMVCNTHHAVVVPDSCIGSNQKMNDSNIVTGGYPGSKMYGSDADHTGGNLAEAVAIIVAAFGTAHILSHREYFENAVTNGKPSSGKWFDSKIDLMNERMVYGDPVFSVANDGSTIPVIYTTSKSQLAMFRLDPSMITNRVYWWLRDPVSSSHFADVHYVGSAGYLSAGEAYGVRPCFAICKQNAA